MAALRCVIPGVADRMAVGWASSRIYRAKLWLRAACVLQLAATPTLASGSSAPVPFVSGRCSWSVGKNQLLPKRLRVVSFRRVEAREWKMLLFVVVVVLPTVVPLYHTDIFDRALLYMVAIHSPPPPNPLYIRFACWTFPARCWMPQIRGCSCNPFLV